MLYGGDKMIVQLPEATHVHKRIPKEAFYKHLSLSGTLKSKFVSDIRDIYVEWDINAKNLRLQKVSDIKEILFMQIELKKQSFDNRIIETIAKQNEHKLVFILHYQNNFQLAVYYKKLYFSDWYNKDNYQLTIDGYTLNDIWNNIIKQIGLKDECLTESETTNISIDDQLKTQEKIDKLKKQITKIEKLAWKEVQPKKQFELYKRLEKLKKDLEDLIDGEA